MEKSENSAAIKTSLPIDAQSLQQVAAAINNALPVIIGFTNGLSKYLALLHEQSNYLLKINRVFQALMESLRQSPEFMEALQKLSKERYEEALGAAFSEFYERLDKYSWFLDAETPMSAPVKILEWLDEGKEDVVERALADFYRSRLLEIEQTLIATFPNRRNILEAAFRAHRNGDYTLSIPAFLAQADGLSNDIYQSSFFQAKKSIPIAKTFLEENNVDAVVVAFAHPLTHHGTIRQSTHLLPQGSNLLNRHAILHGISSDYGTEINSLKCVSLLSCLHGVTVMMSAKKDLVLA